MPEQLAKRVIASLGSDCCVPFNIEKIIRKHGVIIDAASLPPSVNGMFYPGTPPIIIINKNLHPHRARFTLAHEFYHHLDYTRKPLKPEVRFSHSYVMERRANKFAACLLMPEEVLRALLDLGKRPEEVAEICQVSRQAMQNRLKELRIAWED